MDCRFCGSHASNGSDFHCAPPEAANGLASSPEAKGLDGWTGVAGECPGVRERVVEELEIGARGEGDEPPGKGFLTGCPTFWEGTVKSSHWLGIEPTRDLDVLRDFCFAVGVFLISHTARGRIPPAPAGSMSQGHWTINGNFLLSYSEPHQSETANIIDCHKLDDNTATTSCCTSNPVHVIVASLFIPVGSLLEVSQDVFVLFSTPRLVAEGNGYISSFTVLFRIVGQRGMEVKVVEVDHHSVPRCNWCTLKPWGQPAG